MSESQAHIAHYMEDERASSGGDVGMIIRQPDRTQASRSEEESKPSKSAALSLPLTNDILIAGFNKVALAGSHAPMPVQPKRHLRSSRWQPTAPLAENPPAPTKANSLPVVTQVIDAESAVPKLTFARPTAGQHFNYGTQTTQYGRDEYERQQDLTGAGFMEVLVENKRGEKLITTPYLRRLGLSFNTRYQLVICTQCAEGLPSSYIHTHLSNLDARRANKNSLGIWTATKVAYESMHPWPISRLPSSRVLQSDISASLLAAGFTTRDAGIDPNFGVASVPAWSQIPLPQIPIQGNILERPQILGLRVFDNVWCCTKCDLFRTNKASMATHMATAHKGSRLEKHTTRAYAQTLSEVPGWMTLFEVSNFPTSLTSESENQATSIANNGDLDRSATLALLRQKKATGLEGIEVVPDKEVRTVPPVFMRTGVDQFLSQFNRKALHENFTPDCTDPQYLDLRSALLPTFVNNVDSMKTAPTHHSIYTSITNCTPLVDKFSHAHKFRAYHILVDNQGNAAHLLHLRRKMLWHRMVFSRLS